MTISLLHLELVSLCCIVAYCQPYSLVRKEGANGTQALILADVTDTAAEHEFQAMVIQTCYGASLLVVALITILYWSKGLPVICKVLVYLFALTTVKGAVKIVESNHFEFPLFLTATHFAFCAIVTLAIMYYRKLVTRTRFVTPTLRCFTTMYLPIACCFGTSVAMCNMALVTSSTSFVEIIGGSGPIITVIMMPVMGKPFHLTLLAPCFILFIGCALCTNADPTFTISGLILAAGSQFPRSLKILLQQVLMKTDGNETVFSPLEVLAWTCVPSFFVMLVASTIHEGLAPYLALRSVAQQAHFWRLFGAILLSCVNALILNSSNLFVVKDLGAVGSSIVAQTKSMLVVLGGVSLLGEKIPRMEIIGFFLVMIGIFMYNALEARLKPQEKTPESASKEEKQPLLKRDAQRT